MNNGPVNGAGKPRVLHEYSFEVMPIEALPIGEIKTITPYWSQVLQELHRLPADKAIFFKHYNERPLTTEISKMRANFATQLRRYMPDAKLVVTRDVVRGGIFIHHAKEAPAPTLTKKDLRELIPHLMGAERAHAEQLLAEAPDDDDPAQLKRIAPTYRDEIPVDDAARAAAAIGAMRRPPEDDDEDVTLDDLMEGAFMGILAAGAPLVSGPSVAASEPAVPRRRPSKTADKDGELIVDPNACSCAPYWKATAGFRKYPPDRHGPYHQGTCPLWSSWQEMPEVARCDCAAATRGPEMLEFTNRHGSDPQAYNGDVWNRPGEQHAASCPRHVHRFILPASGSGGGRMQDPGKPMPSICKCGATKDHQPYSDPNNTILVRTGGRPKSSGEEPNADAES